MSIARSFEEAIQKARTKYLHLTGIKMNNKRIQELEEKIADLKKRWPAHSVPPAMVWELEDLEEELAEELEQVHQEKNHA